MGGNAITSSQRIPRSEYESFKQAVICDVKELFTLVDVPREMPNKESFGDLDVVVQAPKSLTTATPTISSAVAYLATKWESKQIIQGSAVISMEYKNHQVDLIPAKGGHDGFRMTVDFMSFGDLGTLIGMICKRLGLKFGLHGLECPIAIAQEKKTQETLHSNDAEKPGEIILGWITLSKSMRPILTYLDLDPIKWTEGFNDDNEVFDFIAASKFYNPHHFANKNDTIANSSLRKRIKIGRKMFVSFVEYSGKRIDETEGVDDISSSLGHLKNCKAASRWDAIDHFGKREEAEIMLSLAKDRMDRQRRLKEKFSGNRVSELTGAQGETVGEIIKRFKKKVLEKAGMDSSLPAKDVYEDALLGMSISDIDALVLTCASELE
ncbi:hypothetical protein HDU67_006722 [Dinochytrium kinnereticum]|nr:hypothetical protein HDU67_006722 [Dinochytrium kinnereticum]